MAARITWTLSTLNMLPAKTKSEVFDYRTPTRWRICFFLVSILPLSLAFTFWAQVLGNGRANGAWAILILAIASALPMCFGFCLLYFSIRSVRFQCTDKAVTQTTRFLGLSRTRILKTNQITLKRASFGHRNPRIWLAIYRHHGESKSLLANEQSCDRVQELYAWLEQTGEFLCWDESSHSFGG